MFRINLVLLISIAAAEGNAQHIRRYYYDTNGTVADSAESYYYQESIFIDGKWTYKSYYTSSGTVRSEEKQDSAGKKRYVYFPNKAIRAIIQLDSLGWEVYTQTFYPNGDPQGEWAHEKSNPLLKNKSTLKIISYRDSLGGLLVTNGHGQCHCILSGDSENPYIESGIVSTFKKNGLWTGRKNNGIQYEETYDDGELVSGTLTDADGVMFTYNELETSAEPAEGLQTFYKFIAANMKYPAKARRMGVEGIVSIEFVVEKDGSLTNLIVLKGIGAGCDEQALNAVKSSPKWKPGTQRGKVVRQRFVLPITFKLN